MSTAVRRKGAQPLVYDLGLLFPVLMLVGMGIVMVYSASGAMALKKFGSDYFFLKKQAVFSLIGIVVLVGFSYIPYRIYRVLVYPMLVISMAMLVAVAFTGWGVSVNNASRWLQLGALRFQPSEVARLALVIYLAYSMSKKGELLRDFFRRVHAPFSRSGPFYRLAAGSARFRVGGDFFGPDVDHAFCGRLPFDPPFLRVFAARAHGRVGHDPGQLSAQAIVDFSGSLEGSDRCRVADHPLVDGFRHRGPYRRRRRQGLPEAVLSP